MRYVDAGYIVALTVLFSYSVSLIARRRRLEKVASLQGQEPSHILVEADRSTGPDQGAP